jgi:hypothetical protein
VVKNKASIDREKIMQEAVPLFAGQANIGQSILEVAFKGEEGTGTGPTREFYN